MDDADTTRPRAAGPLELVIFHGSGTKTIALPSSGTIRIGRSDDNDVRIDDPSVSRRHALLHIGANLCVEDLGSVNGTRIRGTSALPRTTELLEVRANVAEPVPFLPGDIVTIGTVTIVVRHGAGVSSGASVPSVVVGDPAMHRLYELAQRVAVGEINVLILGETGVGKEVLAETIHRNSPRARGPFLGVNCGAFTETLLESELFGHERGAFTGAVAAKPGIFEAAAGGTVFLDEIGEMPATVQVKLLRVIESRMVLRVGAVKPRPIDVRLISATNRNLDAEVALGSFRQDLYFRLNGVSLVIPPLRERTAEIQDLATLFIQRTCEQLARKLVPTLSPKALAMLRRHVWPGNIRELRNAMERAVTLCTGPMIQPEHLLLETPRANVPATADATSTLNVSPATAAEPGGLRAAVESAERQHIIDALARCGGNQTHAAKLLGISRRTLVTRIELYGITRPRKRK